MRTLRRLSELSSGECWLLLQAVFLLPVVRLALLRKRVADLMQIAERKPESSKDDVDPQAAARIVRIAAQHGLYRAKCLEQSLVLRWLLQRQGIDGRIVFGARRNGEQVQAHAWVEINGLPL